jgi:competence protein ComEC
MRLVYISLGWVAGILLAANLKALIPLFWLITLAISVLLLGLVWSRHWRWWLAALVAFTFAGYRYQFVPQTSELAQYNTFGGATVEGLIVSEPDIRDDRIQMQLAVETIQLGSDTLSTEGLLLVNAPRTAEVQYGDRVRVTGELSTPAEYDTFSYSAYLGRQGVFSVMSNAVVEIINQGEGIAFYRIMFQFKTILQDHISQSLPEPEAALLTGILLGNERGIDPKLSEDFSRVGASHIIAISGFNMAIIAGVVMGGLERALKRKRLAVFLGIIVLALYTLLVGANAAVVRAAIMSSMLVIAPLLKRKTYVPASLASVVIMMSFQNPLVLWDLSFQLSFFAVLGLALFTEPLTKRFDALLNGFFPRSIARLLNILLNEPVVVSLAALSMTLPLIVLYFQRFSLVSLLVNVLIVPVQPLVLMLGGVALLTAMASPDLAQFLFWLDYVLLKWSIWIVRVFSDLSFAELSLSINGRFIWLFLGTTLGAALVNATRPKWAIRLVEFIRMRLVLNAVLLSGAGIFILLLMIFTSRPDGMLHVWWLDVGHSNAVLLQTPGGAQVLVDGGSYPSRLLTSLGDRMPFNDRSVEVLIITSPGEFNSSALTAVLNRYDAGLVLTNGQENLSEAYQAIETAIAPYDVLAVRAGYRVELSDGTLIEVLHPQSQPEINDRLGDGAMVLRVSDGEVSFLLTSDLSTDGQSILLESGQWPLASVIQIPQHGTVRGLSDNFVNAVQPQIAILQSDIGNRRGDPDDNTLAQVGDIPIFRTDEMGTLHLWTDGHTLWVSGEG